MFGWWGLKITFWKRLEPSIVLKTFSLFSCLFSSKSLSSICLMEYEGDTFSPNFDLRHGTMSFTSIKYSPTTISFYCWLGNASHMIKFAFPIFRYAENPDYCQHHFISKFLYVRKISTRFVLGCPVITFSNNCCPLIYDNFC